MALWKQYMEEFKEMLVPYVTKQMFNSIWNSIFPDYFNRCWISNTGKCKFCGWIDAGRKSTNDKAVKEALKRAHHSHRGVFFMQERSR